MQFYLWMSFSVSFFLFIYFGFVKNDFKCKEKKKLLAINRNALKYRRFTKCIQRWKENYTVSQLTTFWMDSTFSSKHVEKFQWSFISVWCGWFVAQSGFYFAWCLVNTAYRQIQTCMLLYIHMQLTWYVPKRFLC